jgi:hypothetical protein
MQDFFSIQPRSPLTSHCNTTSDCAILQPTQMQAACCAGHVCIGSGCFWRIRHAQRRAFFVKVGRVCCSVQRLACAAACVQADNKGSVGRSRVARLCIPVHVSWTSSWQPCFWLCYSAWAAAMTQSWLCKTYVMDGYGRLGITL